MSACGTARGELLRHVSRSQGASFPRLVASLWLLVLLSGPSTLRAEWLCPDTCSTTDPVLEQTWTVDPSTGAVGGLGGAVSEMFTLELDGVPFEVSGLPAVDLATDNLIVGPHAHGALSVRRHYRLMPGGPELRVATELLNTSGIPLAVSLVLRGSHAAGPDVQVALTASGDARVDAWDHWLHLDDGLEDDEGVPDLLIASDGVGVCPVGALDVDLHPDGTLEWYYALTVPGGSQVKLVHLLGLAADDEDALLGLSGGEGARQHAIA